MNVYLAKVLLLVTGVFFNLSLFSQHNNLPLPFDSALIASSSTFLNLSDPISNTITFYKNTDTAVAVFAIADGFVTSVDTLGNGSLLMCVKENGTMIFYFGIGSSVPLVLNKRIEKGEVIANLVPDNDNISRLHVAISKNGRRLDTDELLKLFR